LSSPRSIQIQHCSCPPCCRSWRRWSLSCSPKLQV
jgi:hypothetical protein